MNQLLQDLRFGLRLIHGTLWRSRCGSSEVLGSPLVLCDGGEVIRHRSLPTGD